MLSVNAALVCVLLGDQFCQVCTDQILSRHPNLDFTLKIVSIAEGNDRSNCQLECNNVEIYLIFLIPTLRIHFLSGGIKESSCRQWAAATELSL